MYYKNFEKRNHEAGIGDRYKYDSVYHLIETAYDAPLPEINANGFVKKEAVDYSNTDFRNSIIKFDSLGIIEQKFYQPNALHQAVEIDAVQGANGNNRAYNRNGNLTQNETGDLYEFDYANKLVKVSTKDANNLPIDVVFTYDCTGRKIQKTVTQTNTNTVIVDEHYYYSGEEVIAEYNSADQLLRSYVLGERIDIPVVLTEGAFDFYFVYDTHGSVIAITNATGAIEERYKYDAHGNFEVLINSQWVNNRYFYAARDWEAEIKLYHNRARFYDPQNGFFIQRDPLGYVDGSNPYLYTSGNPINYSDPLGLIKEQPREPSRGDWDYSFFHSDKVAWRGDIDKKGVKQGFKDYYKGERITILRIQRVLNQDNEFEKREELVYMYDPKYNIGNVREFVEALNAHNDVSEVFVNGILNSVYRASELAETHTTYSDNEPVLVVSNGTHGPIADITSAALEKIGGKSEVSQLMGLLFANRAIENVPTHIVAHSDGAFKTVNMLKFLRKNIGIKSWSNLETEWHGSPVNYLKAYYRTSRVGGRFWSMNNHPKDFVAKLGLSSGNPFAYLHSILHLPSLFREPAQNGTFYGSRHTLYPRETRREGFWKGFFKNLVK